MNDLDKRTDQGTKRLNRATSVAAHQDRIHIGARQSFLNAALTLYQHVPNGTGLYPLRPSGVAAHNASNGATRSRTLVKTR